MNIEKNKEYIVEIIDNGYEGEGIAKIDNFIFPSAGRLLRFIVYLTDYLITGYDILKKAFKGIKNKQIFVFTFRWWFVQHIQFWN